MTPNNFFDGAFFDGGFFDAGVGGGHGGAGQHGRGKKGRRRELPPIYRFLVEFAGETYYFGSEAEARAFMQKQARVLYKRAHVVARSKIIAEPAKRISLPAPQPIPRFVAQGNDAISLLTQRINARIDAIIANPARDADEDDADLADLMSDADETEDDKDLRRILQ